jgi:hypothetical protein
MAFGVAVICTPCTKERTCPAISCAIASPSSAARPFAFGPPHPLDSPTQARAHLELRWPCIPRGGCSRAEGLRR